MQDEEKWERIKSSRKRSSRRRRSEAFKVLFTTCFYPPRAHTLSLIIYIKRQKGGVRATHDCSLTRYLPLDLTACLCSVYLYYYTLRNMYILYIYTFTHFNIGVSLQKHCKQYDGMVYGFQYFVWLQYL